MAKNKLAPFFQTRYRTEICAFLALLCKFGCYGNSLCSPKIFISIFQFSDPKNHTCKHCLHSFYRTEICGILDYYCLILVAMAIPLARSKIQVAYLNSTTPYLHAKKISRFLARN